MAMLQLVLQTLNLVVGFAAWVILSGLMPFIKQDIPMSPGQLTFVTAVPVVLGSLFRIPIGYYANRFGARLVFVVSFIVLIIPVFIISTAHSFVQLIVGGFLLGISGAVFSVGVTSLPKYFSREKLGLVNGIYGMGNMGNALTTFFGPIIASRYGWVTTVRVFILLLLGCAILTFILGDRHEAKIKTSVVEQIRDVYKNDKLWLFSLFYFISFGAYVAFTVYLPNFLVSEFHLTKVDAGFRTAGFIVLATVLRPAGGWLADRWDAYKVLMFVFAGMTVSGVALSFPPTLLSFTIGCLLVSLCAGIGNGVIFRLVPMNFKRQAGFANGFVAAFGGLGGFFPPLMLTSLRSITGNYEIGFMALSECALASFVVAIWLFFRERLQLSKTILDSTVEGIMVTDLKGVIQSINESFTTVTGYSHEDIVGKTPAVLKSGKQDEAFYQDMWRLLDRQGHWDGEIWNRRKNGELYLEWLTISEVRDEAGDITHYVGMFSDVTQVSARKGI